MKPHSIIWWILPGFLAIDAALLIPLKTIQWDYLGNLPLLLVSVAALAAQFAVLSAWAAMADGPWWTRLGCFALILAGVYGASVLIDEGGLQVFLTTAFVSFAGAAGLRTSGWRLQRVPRAERGQSGRLSWQFSLADLIFLTLGCGILLGLFRWRVQLLELNDSLVVWIMIGTFAVGLFTSVAVGLTSRRIWRAIGVALVGVPLGNSVVQVLLFPNAGIVAFVTLLAGVCVVPIILLIRMLGVRLVDGCEQGA